MSNYSKLILNNQEADAFSLQEVPLNFKTRISNSEGEPAGGFTRSSIKIPATKTNKSILEGLSGYFSFRIEIAGSVVLSGLARIQGSENDTDCYKCIDNKFELVLFGGNNDWFLPLRECTLDELTTEITKFNQSNILNGFNADPNLVNFGFTPIKLREWLNSKIVPEDDGTGTGTDINRLLETPSVYECTPFLFIRPLIIEAFRKAGYTINSNFFDSDFFKRLIFPVPLPGKMPEIYNEQYLNFEGSKDVITITPLTTGFYNTPYDVITEPPLSPGVWSVTLYEYTAPETGFYEVEIGATYGPEVGTFSYVYINAVTINGASTLPSQGGAGWGDGGILSPFVFPTNQSRKSTGVYEVNAGDKIAVATITVTDTNFTVLNSFVKIRGEAKKAPGLTIDFKYLVQQYSFLDMFKDLVRIFKLSIGTDTDAKTVLIEPSDPYSYKLNTPVQADETREGYYLIGDNLIYTQKVDYSKKVKTKRPILEGTFKFIYNSDGDETTKAREQNEKYEIYEAVFNGPEGSDKSKTKEIKTDFFSKTVHVRDDLTRYPNTNVKPQFPLIYAPDFNYVLNPTAKEDDVNYDFGPRLLWFGGQRGGLDGYIEIFETGLQTETPAAFMVNYNDLTGLDPNLSFSSEIINGLSVPGVVLNYHKHCISRLTQQRTKKASICLNAIELDNFSFRNRIIIDDKRYIILEVNSVNPLENEPPQFLFILDEFADGTIEAAIENSNLRGVFSLVV